MMLPILISVSVTPVSYFFWAAAGRLTAAANTPASPSVLICVLIGVLTSDLKKSLSTSFMSCLPGPGVTDFSDGFLFDFSGSATENSSPSRRPEAANDAATLVTREAIVARDASCGAAMRLGYPG